MGSSRRTWGRSAVPSRCTTSWARVRAPSPVGECASLFGADGEAHAEVDPSGQRGVNVAAPSTSTGFGVASEVGTLHTVMVHRPDLAHERLSPTNCHELLFDDVIWTRRARQEFDAFVDLMRSRDVEVLLVHELLAETLEDMEAREWLLSRRVRPEDVTVMFVDALREWLTGMAAEDVAS